MVAGRARRGTVAIENYKGMLRLRWSYGGKRYCLSLGMPDTKVNQTVAEARARLIEGDLVTSNFDSTLDKYQAKQKATGTTIAVVELVKRFIKHRQQSGESITKYKTLQKPVADYFGSRAAAAIDEEIADGFRLYLARSLAPATQKERLISIRACWKWGIKQKLLSTNPWPDVVKRVKVPPTQKPRPFNEVEIRLILDGFREDRYYRHYADFVEFLLSTGCRIGEAIALQWKHLSGDCSKVWIGETIARKGKKRKPTKTNRARQFRLTPKLQKMLIDRRPSHWKGEDSVFPAPRGGLMDDHLFCLRAWTKTLKRLGVEYRHPYCCRHTFISHSLARGVLPMAIAEMTGHDPQVLFKHYAADIAGGLQLPDIFTH